MQVMNGELSEIGLDMKRMEAKGLRKEVLGERGLKVQELSEKTGACINVGRIGTEANVVEVLGSAAQVQVCVEELQEENQGLNTSMQGNILKNGGTSWETRLGGAQSELGVDKEQEADLPPGAGPPGLGWGVNVFIGGVTKAEEQEQKDGKQGRTAARRARARTGATTTAATGTGRRIN